MKPWKLILLLVAVLALDLVAGCAARKASFPLPPVETQDADPDRAR